MVGKLLSIGTVVSLSLIGMAATQDTKPAAATSGVNAYQVDDVLVRAVPRAPRRRRPVLGTLQRCLGHLHALR